MTYSASLEFMRMVAPVHACGRAIIDRCMTDERILQVDPLEELPDIHRPNQANIAAKLKADHEYTKRLTKSMKRKLERKVQGAPGAEYAASDEVWSHFKPTDEELLRWINLYNTEEHSLEEQSAPKTTDESSVGSAAEPTSNGKYQ